MNLMPSSHLMHGTQMNVRNVAWRQANREMSGVCSWRLVWVSYPTRLTLAYVDGLLFHYM